MAAAWRCGCGVEAERGARAARRAAVRDSGACSGVCSLAPQRWPGTADTPLCLRSRPADRTKSASFCRIYRMSTALLMKF